MSPGHALIVMEGHPRLVMKRVHMVTDPPAFNPIETLKGLKASSVLPLDPEYKRLNHRIDQLNNLMRRRLLDSNLSNKFQRNKLRHRGNDRRLNLRITSLEASNPARHPNPSLHPVTVDCRKMYQPA